MTINLFRRNFRKDGVFGEIEYGKYYFFTLEHAYSDHGHIFTKLLDGEYVCKRGKHRLHDGIEFETFEITGVPNHTGILFHVGNYNKDSDGCVLLGLGLGSTNNKEIMLTSSKQAFKTFMDIFLGVDEFILVVESSDLQTLQNN